MSADQTTRARVAELQRKHANTLDRLRAAENQVELLAEAANNISDEIMSLTMREPSRLRLVVAN